MLAQNPVCLATQLSERSELGLVLTGWLLTAAPANASQLVASY